MRFAAFAVCLCVLLHVASAGFYFATDYFMNPSVSKTFYGACGETMQDDFSWINSHIHIFKTRNYANNKDCWIRYNYGTQRAARYKFYVDFFELEDSPGCSKDVLEVYDGFAEPANANVTRSFCGNSLSFNMTGLPTQRYVVFRFKTDGSNTAKGFRVGALRYEVPNNTAPVGDKCRKDDPNGEYFYCASENICIDPRLQCDGTAQCWYREDEQGCSSTEKFIGYFLNIGLQGMVTFGIGICLGIVVIVVVCYVITKVVKRYQKNKEKQEKEEKKAGKSGYKSGTVSPAPDGSARNSPAPNSPPPAEPTKNADGTTVSEIA